MDKKKKLIPSIPPPMPSAPKVRLRVIKGPHKGVAYKLVAGKITIGRSSENDIVLANDEKCSRKQALVTLDANNIYSIKDLSKKSPIKVNETVSIKSELQDGDLIQFGSTVLQFEFKGTALSPSPQGPPPLAPLVPVPLNPAGSSENKEEYIPLNLEDKQKDSLPSLHQDQLPPTTHSPLPHKSPGPAYYPTGGLNNKKKKRFMPKIILGFLVLGGLWLFLQDSEQQKKTEKEDKLRTLINVEENIKTLSELKEKELEKRNKNALSSYKNAQFAYIKGIRDYRKGVYSRAIEAFRVCKTLYPQHELCASYLQKAKIKRQQLIQAWMIAGKDYREKRRFKACMSSFQNVMTAIRDNTNLTYKEASENFNICKIQHGDRY